ncbi:hypothetical protein LRAMOSA06317 [Lichtheimia ramosa]|uniref:FAS1 domain-containing protein n=1 Tax=Lichtheimia ramosa TaxID=688394 RepID=A0A077X4W8_9FUNG|nr:hypothetical protein LRAMOSA06317 [Lichtheimia ramosa]
MFCVWLILGFLVNLIVAQDSTILDVLPDNGAGALYNALMAHHHDLVYKMQKPDASFTLFAPTDDALQASGLDVSSPNATDVFQYHLLDNARLSLDEIHSEARLRNTSYIPGNGKRHHMPYLMGTGPNGIWSYGNKSQIVHGDVQASNGVVHFVDRVLQLPAPAEDVLQSMPETRAFAEQLHQLNMSLSLVTHATIFAPTNDAVAQLNATISDIPTRALTLQHLIIDKSFSPTVLAHRDSIVNEHGLGFNVTHNNDTKQPTSIIEGVTIKVPDQIYKDGIIHITDGIILRGGLEQPNVSLPEKLPEVTNSATALGPFIASSTMMMILALSFLYLQMVV